VRVTCREPVAWPATLPANRREALALVADRYRGLGSEPYLFAWSKLRLDPMFRRLVDLVGDCRQLLDLGAGYGLPAVWLLAHHAELRVTAVESDPARARVAASAIGARGTVHRAALPDLPRLSEKVDRALLIDVVHYLDDDALATLLAAVRARLSAGAMLLVRDTVPSGKSLPWERWLEGFRLGRRGVSARFRSEDDLCRALERAGFAVTTEATPGREETWFVAQPEPFSDSRNGSS
jgi:uncharacterized protein